jgi:hypothetical protein
VTGSRHAAAACDADKIAIAIPATGSRDGAVSYR